MLKWLTSCHLLLHAGMWTKVSDVTECTEHVRELLQFLFNRPIYFVVHCKEENQSRNGYKQEQHPAIRHWRCTWSSKWIVKEPVVPAVVWGHCPHANVRHSSKGAHLASTSLPFFCTSQITTGRNCRETIGTHHTYCISSPINDKLCSRREFIAGIVYWYQGLGKKMLGGCHHINYTAM